jgi:penicillin-binding protein 1A
MATTTPTRRRPPSRPRRPPVRRRAKKTRRSWLWRYRRVLFLLAFLVATAGAGVLFVLFQAPLPPAPSLASLKQTTFLTDANGQRLATFHGAENRTIVTLDKVPPIVRQAVVAVEDRNFYEHSGVDPIGITRALITDLRHRNVKQGGSTITQQYVKNTYVGRERSAWRKIREAVISVKLERQLTKDEILERYLNTIYFGRGAYGVQAAAQAYFGRDVTELGLPEAAFLAGIIRSPERADPAVDPDLAEQRRRLTLRSMERDGYITGAQRRQVEATPLWGISGYVVPREQLARQTEVALPDKGTQYFVEYVRRFLVDRYGEQAVYGGGLRVRTTLDLTAQARAYDAVYGFLDRRGDPSGALVAMDPDGRVKAMVGGRDFATLKVNLAAGRAGGGVGRQAGSTFKVFALAQAVREGYTVESAFAAPKQVEFELAGGEMWRPSNYEGASYPRMNLVDATKKSVNTVYAQLVMLLGPEKVAQMAEEMGVTSDLAPHPSLVLGTQNVSVLEMATAYNTLANRGVRADPQVVLEVTDADGNRIETFHPDRRRVLEREQADVVNSVLRQVVESGTGAEAAFGKPSAGKTGTTQDYGDAWYIGYTPKLTAAVWMGYPEGQSHRMLNVHGKKVSGGTWPAVIFRRFMSTATRDLDTGDFPRVTRFPGKVLKGDRISFRDVSPTTTSATDAGSTATTAVSSPAASTPAAPATTASPTTTAPTPTTSPPTTAAPTPSTTEPPKRGGGGGPLLP